MSEEPFGKREDVPDREDAGERSARADIHPTLSDVDGGAHLGTRAGVAHDGLLDGERRLHRSLRSLFEGARQAEDGGEATRRALQDRGAESGGALDDAV